MYLVKICVNVRQRSLITFFHWMSPERKQRELTPEIAFIKLLGEFSFLEDAVRLSVDRESYTLLTDTNTGSIVWGAIVETPGGIWCL